MLKTMKENGKIRQGQNGRKSSGTIFSPVKLSDLGITLDQSSTWQTVAAVPVEVFEQYIAERQRTRRDPSCQVHRLGSALSSDQPVDERARCRARCRLLFDQMLSHQLTDRIRL